MAEMQTQRPSLALDEWRAEMGRHGKLDCKFVCPFCENEASPNDFAAAGADPERAARECIGRVVGAKGGLHGEREKPCDWAAFGLLGTLNGGTRIALPDGGEVWVFDFAEATARPENRA